MEYTVKTFSAAETEQAGASLAAHLYGENPEKKQFVCLTGDLGAGKTAFVRGFASVLSPGSRVKSPSYTVVNEYRKGNIPIFHFDLYRLEESEDALDGMGFDEYTESGHCILEWSEYLPAGLCPPDAVKVNIKKVGDNDREITVCL